MATKVRNYNKEQFFDAHTVIGYVPLDSDGKPYQPTLGSSWRARKKPVTIYKTVKRAVSLSPVQSAAQVRMFVPL